MYCIHKRIDDVSKLHFWVRSCLVWYIVCQYVASYEVPILFPLSPSLSVFIRYFCHLWISENVTVYRRGGEGTPGKHNNVTHYETTCLERDINSFACPLRFELPTIKVIHRIQNRRYLQQLYRIRRLSSVCDVLVFVWVNIHKIPYQNYRPFSAMPLSLSSFQHKFPSNGDSPYDFRRDLRIMCESLSPRHLHITPSNSVVHAKQSHNWFCYSISFFFVTKISQSEDTVIAWAHIPLHANA